MNELEWLRDQRPDVPAPDDDTTAYARTALLAHARDDIAGPRRGSRPDRKAPLYALAAVVFAVAIVVAAGALPSGDGPTRRIGAPVVAEAAPLVKLSNRIAAQPAPAGDATLVLRSHDFPDAKDFTGADLYLDDGRYFYGTTLAQLKADAQHGDIGEGVPKQEREAAKAALNLAADEARRRMIDATWAGGHEPTKPPKLGAAEKAVIKRKQPANVKPASKLTMDNNRIWLGSMDALIAGAGDADVRAGVMKLLSTMPLVKVSDHGATLDLTNTDFSDHYQETLTVDAKTGVIEKLVGQTAGQPPSVTVTYDIQRVDANDILGTG